MNENARLVKLFVSLVCLIILFAALAISPGNDDKPLQDEEPEDLGGEEIVMGPQVRGTRGGPRTVLAELFTQWNCGPCATANPAINELLDVYSRDQLVMISTHTWWPVPDDDPFYWYNKPDCNARISYYGVDAIGVPDMYMDGSHVTSGWTYDDYNLAIQMAMGLPAALAIDMEGYYTPTQGVVNISIEVLDPISPADSKVKFAVVEDNRYEMGANNEPWHRYVLRDMLPQEAVTGSIPGEFHNTSVTFTRDPNWNMGSVSLVVYVQDDKSLKVHQAAMYDFIPQKILVVDDDASGHPNGLEDYYMELLCQMNYSFDGWILNERGSPDSYFLKQYDAVIWITGSTSSDTLNVMDRDFIADYLDNDRGSIFVCGENIGADIGLSSFYRDYLHAEYFLNDVGLSQITGVMGDPISAPFAFLDLPIVASSPSEIAPWGGASIVFTYSGSGASGGIRAQHDRDSRVVFFEFLYFEGSDSDMNKMMLMEFILNWMIIPQDTIFMEFGWNLISIPNIQSDTSLDAAMDSIKDDYDAVQNYHAADANDPWKHYNKYKPPAFCDLNEINHEKGLWVRIDNTYGVPFTFNGTAPVANQFIDLKIGWNLVGYPATQSNGVASALGTLIYGSDIDSIWTYSALKNKWIEITDSDNFKVGRAYWIHSNVEASWEVPV